MTAQPPSRTWLVYFVLLVVLGGVAILAPVLYNRSIQLTPGQIDAARAKWAAAGVRDYDLDYRVRRDRDPRPDVYHVAVRDGRAVRVVCNGHPMLLDDPAAGLALGATAGLFRDEDPDRQTVEGILDHFARVATRAAAGTRGRHLSGEPPAVIRTEAGGRDYCVARFDATLGHPIHFVHRVSGTSQRQEWTIQLTPVRP